MESQPNLASLWLQLQNSYIETLDHRSFVPPTSLTAIFSLPAIKAAVSELSCAAEDRIGLVNDIHGIGIPTFALLVSIKQPDLVVAFRRKRCLDQLPLDEKRAREAAGDYAPTFLRQQWEFIPFHFRNGQDVEIGREILPFVRSLGQLTPGGFGDIEKLEIHPSLQDFAPHDSQQVIVVRKVLREYPDVSFESRLARFNNEKRCLRLINHPLHPNIVPLLGAYVRGHELSLLFTPLDMDLKAFLSRAEPYGHFRWRFTYFSALHGLASALTRAHEVRVSGDGADFDGIGYHHDLRPANVLVNSETFLLADFGMGGVRELEDGSTTPFKAVRGDYSAPECMGEDYVPLDVGRAIDVWALGCLISEVMTYACLGVEGLNRFRKLRKVANSSGNRDSFFHGIRGQVKTEVIDWLNYLTSDEQEHPPALDVPLRDLILSIFTPASSRPTVRSISQNLAHLSLKAHLSAVLDSLATLINGNHSVLGGASLMRLWFERERLQAFSTVLRLSPPILDDTVSKFAVQHGEICIPVLLQLYNKFSQAAQGATGVVDASSGGHDAIVASLADDIANDRITLEADAQRLVQQLWDLLSDEDCRKAERIWVHSMLDATDSVDKLGKMERNLGAQRSVAYQQGAAMAAMKKIRLEILHGSGSDEGLDELEIRESDIPRLDLQLTCGHRMGVYKTTSHVLIESVYYDPSWEKVPPEERTIVMAHKANGFNSKHQLPTLRLLKCLGFFERTTDGNSEGFSFVYLVPEPKEGLDPPIHSSERSVMTLNRLLELSICTAKKSKTDQYMTQPILCDKFRLASILADFLAEFHTIGWLHENFHSNNIVFCNVPPGLKESGISPVTSSILYEPFIVGLNKSRPGGEGWHTQGPSAETDFLDYRHPAYLQTGHFRVGYDYYSLGVMLLEIGLWVPLSTVANHPAYRTATPSVLRNALVTHYVPRLGCKMGRVYQDVVHVLLSDQLDPNPDLKSVDHKQESLAFSRFVEDVVGPLHRLASNFV